MPPGKVTATPTSEDAPAARAYPILLAGHADFVTSAEFSPDGRRVVTASDDQTAVVWAASAGAPLAMLRGHEKSLTSAHFDETGARVVTTSYDGTARVWDAASGAQLAVFLGHEDWVNDAHFDPGGKRVVTASEDGTARIWDARSGESLAVLSGNSGPVGNAIFSPDGALVATAHADGTVRIWDAVDGDERFVLPELAREGQYTNLAVRAVAFSPDGSHLVAAGEDGFVNLWDTITGANLLRINAHGRGVTWAALSPDGERILSASFLGGVAGLWDAADGSQLASLNHGGVINAVAFSPDGARVATVGSDPTVRVWDAASGELLAALTGHTGPVYTADFGPGGEELVTASQDGTARIWNVAAPSAGLAQEGPWWVLAGVGGLWAVNADGTGATRISGHAFGHGVDVTAWAAPRGGHLAYVTAEDTYYDAALHIVSLPNVQDETIIRLTVDATEPARTAAPGDPALDAVSVVVRDDSFAWSPDGRRLAFTGVREGPTSDLYVYDTATGRVTRLTDGPTQAASPSWSLDGSAILHSALEGANVDTGMHVQAFWVAAADGSGATLVQEGEEQFVGWTAAGELIFYDIDTICGKHDLRAVDLAGGTRSIWEGYFDRVAHEPEGDVLVAVWADTASSEGCNGDQGAGLFLTDTAGAAPLRVVEDQVRELVWSVAAGLFFARTDHGVLAVSRSGEFIDLAVPQASFGFPQVAVGTRDLAWRGDGLWLGSLTSSLDQPPQQLYPQRTIQAQWTPDGARLLFLTADGSLYVAQRPEFVPGFVAEVGVAPSAVWVRP